MVQSIHKPRLVLRVGVVGAIHLTPEQRQILTPRLNEVLKVLTGCIQELSPGVPPFATAPQISSYYAGEKPLEGAAPAPENYPVLRLIGGLADGADQAAFEALRCLEKQSRQTTELAGRCTRFELAAVLPCDAVAYRDNSRVKEKDVFDGLLGACRFVIELDGLCPRKSPDPDHPDPLTVARRNRSFRSQAAVILRQSDLLIAVPDPRGNSAPGGTRETLTRAVQLGIPVVSISLAEGSEGVGIIRHLSQINRGVDASSVQWRDELQQVVITILADPSSFRSGGQTFAEGPSQKLGHEEKEVLEEFFHGVHRRARLRPRMWAWFEKRFKRLEITSSDEPLDPFAHYRRRARDLTAYYSGLYRGAFLANYVLAVLAVTLAVFSLLYVILWGQHHAVLFALGLAKLLVILLIVVNTHQGNKSRWNDKAVDYRYLAERLRTLYYLPRVACLRAASPRSAQYATTALRQNVIDWLFHALIRQAPPSTGLLANGPTSQVFRPDLRQAMQTINDRWLNTQIEYHHATSDTQHCMYEWIERWVSVLNFLVIVVVMLDLLILAAMGMGIHHRVIEVAHENSPWLIFLAAVLPAVVASLNSISFQSECLRIAERSEMTAKVLRERQTECLGLIAKLDSAAHDPDDLGSASLEAIELAESCAQIATDEVAEWSVLYSKELLEP